MWKSRLREMMGCPPHGHSWQVSDSRVLIWSLGVWLQNRGFLITLSQCVKPSAGAATWGAPRRLGCYCCSSHCWNYHHDHFPCSSDVPGHLLSAPTILMGMLLSVISSGFPGEVLLSAIIALCPKAASLSPLSPAQSSALRRPQ